MHTGANVSSTYSNIHEGQRNGRLSVGAGPDDPPLPVVVDVQERLDKHNQRIANLEGRMDYNDERIDEMGEFGYTMLRDHLLEYVLFFPQMQLSWRDQLASRLN